MFHVKHRFTHPLFSLTLGWCRTGRLPRKIVRMGQAYTRAMSIRILVRIEVQPGKAEEQIVAFRDLAPLVRTEEGCLKYELYEVVGSPDEFLLDEEWDTQESLDAHGKTDHMVKAGIANTAFRARPSVATHIALIN